MSEMDVAVDRMQQGIRVETTEPRMIPSEIGALGREIENVSRAASALADRLATGGVLSPAQPSAVSDEKMLSSGVELAETLRQFRDQLGWTSNLLHDVMGRLEL